MRTSQNVMWFGNRVVADTIIQNKEAQEELNTNKLTHRVVFRMLGPQHKALF